MPDDTAPDDTTPDVVPEETGPAAKKTTAKKAARKTAAKKTAAKKSAAKKTARKTAAKKTAATTAETPADAPVETPADAPVETPADAPADAPTVTTSSTTRRRRASRPAAAPAAADLFSAVEAPADAAAAPTTAASPPSSDEAADEADSVAEEEAETATAAGRGPFAAPVFQAPDPVAAPRRRARRDQAAPDDEATSTDDDAPTDAPGTADPVSDDSVSDDAASDDGDTTDGDTTDGEGAPRRRRRRGGRRRRKGGGDAADDQADGDDTQDGDDTDETDAGPAPKPKAAKKTARKKAKQDDDAEGDDGDEAKDSGDGEDDDEQGGSSRRRRRRRRRGGGGGDAETKSAEDEITSVSGSTRLEAKKQRRREGREAGRRRAPIVSEAEFLARRESVKREMVIRQRADLSQIAVLEDDVLVEHYVARESQTSLIGNVYLGRVQNVLPSMEAAFVDIGKGRNAVLYAGEVDWKALGNGKQRRIEEVLKSGQTVLVQVTKDPIGHKGARLTSQISLPGRFLVYVPNNHTSGISRKLPDTERTRLKTLLKEVVPGDAGVIVRTAAEGATEDQLTRDVTALTARWEDIEAKSQQGKAPQLLYAEPDLTLKVVRDLFNEDFASLVVEGDDAWDMVDGYVTHVAPDLSERLTRWDAGAHDGRDVFGAHRIDEQIAKALDRKVWLPSGGSLIIDRTEAMTVVDVNTGKFTGSGGNLEETVTKNNLEAAEEIVRQLRLRDIGGIIVVDFIDMVLESNRDLVLRRMVECLGRDRTRHQVAEVTSLGLVQMTRKRIGTGLLEAFSEPCEHCHGRGLVTHDVPVEPKHADDGGGRGGRRRGGKGSVGGNDGDGGNGGGGNGGGGRSGRGGRRSGRGSGGSDQDGSDQNGSNQDEAVTDPTPAPVAEAPKPAPPTDSALDAAPDVDPGSTSSVTAAPEGASAAALSDPPSDGTPQATPTTPRPRTRRRASRPAQAPADTASADQAAADRTPGDPASAVLTGDGTAP